MDVMVIGSRCASAAFMSVLRNRVESTNHIVFYVDILSSYLCEYMIVFILECVYTTSVVANLSVPSMPINWGSQQYKWMTGRWFLEERKV